MTETAGRRTAPGFIEPNLSEREKLTILGGVLLSMLLAALDQSIVAPAMPTIARELGHEQYLPWIVTGYLLTATAVAPLYGKISDIYGRRPTLYAALLIFLLGSLISALSPNIRERRDASAALFDARGRMVAQAAHIPVHLGAMPESVKAVMAHHPLPGDVFILNDPYRGGSHLPDLTLVEAIALDGRTVGYAAVRAHHADVGGMSPGSMPQGATELVQEGLIIPPVRLVAEGTLDEMILNFILANVRTPHRPLATEPA